MPGVIDSKFHANDSDFDLPTTSRYSLIKDTIASWASGEAKAKGCSSHDFAEAVVEDVLGGKESAAYKGPRAGAVRSAATWFPASILVSNSSSAFMCYLRFPLSIGSFGRNTDGIIWQDFLMSQGQGLKELSQKLIGGNNE